MTRGARETGVVVFNGATGGLGRYLRAAAAAAGMPSFAIRARLEDGSALRRELDGIDHTGPITFIHLAALVSVPACEADPERARAMNVTHAHRTIENVIDWSSRTQASLRVIYVSTGHVYATPVDGGRVAEDAPTSPRSVYARTKLEAEDRIAALALSAGVPSLVARVFGLLAPQQATNYLLPGIIDRVSRNDVDEIPGLDYVRDYLDARDVCRCLMILSSGRVAWPKSIVNVCSGSPTTVRDVLRAVATAMRPSDADDIVRAATSAAGRADDVPWLVGDPSQFIQWTGQRPQQISIAQTVEDALAALAA